jgi:sulfatase maturation enzyme AslB (radical SAM superfamily)
MANHRHQLTQPDFAEAMIELDEKLQFRMRQKGMGTYASIHEALGVLQEEMTEFEAEVHAKRNRAAQIEELKDIAVAAIWAIASIRSGGIDW